jgi:hypothetical protein
MNWKLILLLSLLGLALALLSVYTLSPISEFVVWIVVTIISAVVIGKYAPDKYFLHGFVLAIVNTFWVTVTQVTLFYTYIATHPEYIQMTERLPAALADHPRRLIIYRSPVIAILSGLLVGLFSWIAGKVMNRMK